MGSRKSGRIVLAIYLLVYLCLLVPGHLAAVSADHPGLTDGFHRADPECPSHDSSSCHICLTGGQVFCLGVSCSVDVECDVVTAVVRHNPSGLAVPHVDKVSTRAPPAANI